MKRIAFIYPYKVKQVTGGHFYEAEMISHLCANKKLKIDVFYLWQKKPNFFLKLLSPFLALKLIKELKYFDLVFFNSTKSFYFFLLNLFIKGILKKKTVIIHHHFLYIEFKRIKKYLYKTFEISFLRISNYVLTPSPYIRDELYNKFKITSLFCPIPFDKINYEDENFIREKNKILYVGTIDTRKGINLLINSLIHLQKEKIYPHLHIVGKIVNKEIYEEIKSYIEYYDLHVTFHGFVSSSFLRELYLTSEIFVFPSLMEGFGMSINEALAFGLPVVCFNNSAMPYSVDNSRGRIIQNKDTQAFANAIKELLSNNELRQTLSRNAITYAKSLPSHNDFKIQINSIVDKL